jgi:radical SAM superfamily enzyme YgiQ (UPF0313 family)
MLIYLADLGHNLLTRSSDVYPLGVANLATYLRAHLAADVAPEIRIFREPQDLKRALDDRSPSVLGLSNYAWNEELSNHFAGYAKRRDPRTLVAMGGPNYPLVDEVRSQFLRTLPNVDVYVDGPTYEGERAFLALVRRFDEVGRAIEGLREAPLEGNDWIDPRDGRFARGGPVERIRDLDEIPSPYLAGLLDPYLSGGYFPLLQIARGCPFTCAFCNSGVRSNSRVFAHSVENVKADLLYLAQRVAPETTLCFADDNFGMYERDEEVADYIGWLQDTYGWPRYIRTTTGKNKGERILRVMRKVRGALPMTMAVQSMNPVVLENIQRDNIKLSTYRELQAELAKDGMQGYGELILCLPGETRGSFLEAVDELLDTGAKRISAHQLMLLHGAELANPEARERFRFDTRFRVVARNIGDYTGEPVIEVEEMVVATPDFTFDEYLETRIFHLLLTIFHYEGNFEEPFAFARGHGLKPFELVTELQRSLAAAPAGFRSVLDEFVRESREELFPTRQACLDWARANYEGLVDGTLGGNLLSKYSMIGRFYATASSLEFLEAGIARGLESRGVAFDRGQLATVFEYLRAVALHVPFAETTAAPVEFGTRYDVEAWARDGYAKPLEDYRFDGRRRFRAETAAETRTLILSKLAAFGEHPAGLGKFTRTMFARDLRRTLVREGAGAPAAGPR